MAIISLEGSDRILILKHIIRMVVENWYRVNREVVKFLSLKGTQDFARQRCS